MSGNRAAFVAAFWSIIVFAAPSVSAQDVPEIVPEVAWTFRTGGPIWGSSASADGFTYFGSTDSLIYALDSADGTLLWSFRTGGPIYASVSLKDEYLYAASDDGFVYKLDRADGTEIWRANIHEGTPAERHRPADTPPGNQRWDYRGSAPVEFDGVVFAGSADHRMYAFAADTGEKLWHFETNDIVRSAAVLAGDNVVFGSFDGQVYAVNRATGAEVWSSTLGGVVSTTPAVHDGRVYAGSRSTRLYALDAATGDYLWNYQYGNGSWVESGATVYADTLYIGSSFWSTQLAINPETGRPYWLSNIGGSANSTPLLTEDAYYCGAIGLENTLSGNMKGAILRLDRATGRIVWRYRFEVIPNHYDHGVLATPELVGGLVLFGGLDDVFYALRETQSSVDSEPTETPASFDLGQNYPNPFNPSTSIEVTLERTSAVRLIIYDLQGRAVRTLVDGFQGPGSLTITWDGTDARRQTVPSGSYLYRLEVDGRVAARKMLLVR